MVASEVVLVAPRPGSAVLLYLPCVGRRWGHSAGLAGCRVGRANLLAMSTTRGSVVSAGPDDGRL